MLVLHDAAGGRDDIRIVDAVLRRPLLSASLAGGLLIALAIPALQMHMATPGPDTFPQKLAVVKTYKRMQQEFPGNALPGPCRNSRRQRCSTLGLTSNARAASPIDIPCSSRRTAASLNSLVNCLRSNPMTQFSIQ